MKNAFYFIRKALFVIEIFKCLHLTAPHCFTSVIALEDDRRLILKFMTSSIV